MAKTPDPNYWGNPPQTPTSKYAQNTNGMPPQYPYGQNPYAQVASQPAVNPQPTADPAAPASAEADQQTGAGGQPAPQPAQQPPVDWNYNQPTQQMPNNQMPAQQPGQQAGQQPNPQMPTQPMPGTPGAQYNPYNAAPQKKSSKGIVLAIIIVVVLVLFAGIAACTACSAVISDIAGDSDMIIDSGNGHDGFGSSDSTYTDEETLLMNEQFRETYDLADDVGSHENDNQAITADELQTVAQNNFTTPEVNPNDNMEYAPGVYTVCTDLQAGSYWMTGSNTNISHFYILRASSADSSRYDVVHSNSYYGHNLMELEEGDVLVLDNNGYMLPVEELNDTFNAPYTSGVYRVGTDIPAGTYKLSMGEAEDYGAYYVMSDLKYNDSSYEETNYYAEGTTNITDTITLEEGTYVELYNMQLTPQNA